MKSNVTDAEIADAFKGTNFGSLNHRRVLGLGVLKQLTGYTCGSTLTGIMRKLGLITERGNVTKKGKVFCMGAFYDGRRCG